MTRNWSYGFELGLFVALLSRKVKLEEKKELIDFEVSSKNIRFPAFFKHERRSKSPLAALESEFSRFLVDIGR